MLSYLSFSQSAIVENMVSSPVRANMKKNAFPVRKPNDVDAHVGSRLRQRRMLLGISQEQLAEMLGLTFQQVQKYERGTNRVSASRLFQLARALDTPITWFFDEMESDRGAEREKTASELQDGDPMSRRETLELVRVYSRIDDRKVRKKLYEMAKALAEE
jgi:transcriptional regulator with XRE-family HTH domain